MNASHTLAASAWMAMLACLCVGPALAQSAAPTTRAEVKSEAARARSAGEVPRGEAQNTDARFEPGKTREQRKSETREAIARGEVTSRGDAMPREPVGKSSTSQTTRAAVKKDAAAANKAGLIPRGEAGSGR